MVARTVGRILVLLGIAYIMQPAALGVSSPVLKNEETVASFDGRGLRQIRDIALRTTFGLSQDNFLLVIGNREIRSEELGAPTVHKQADALEYRYDASPYQIKVVYELKPGWRFVSKQIFVNTNSSRASFTVKKVAVVRGRLASVPADVHTAQSRWRREAKDKDYGVFFRYNGAGMFALVQNPFLNIERDGANFSVAYAPEMTWSETFGAFATDRACIGTYALTGARVPTVVTREWKLENDTPPAHNPTIDEGEIAAFTDCVRAFVQEKRDTSTKIQVAWTANDYQIDIATPEGRAEYKRLIDRTAELGLEYMAFAPTNSELALEKDDTDSWHWEHTLWLGLGQKIRRGEWNVATGAIPAPAQELLDYARSRKVKLMAYVYPVLPFQQNPKWLVGEKKGGANLGVRELQDWLIEQLVTFQKRTGIGGYAFDYTWLALPEASEYSQWWGWRRVMESLRKQVPGIVMDGRQNYQVYGPWTWLAGSYPHPTSTDEQPESFTPFPDLHIDRVSANRERYTAYRYRVNDFCPPELMPGFVGHQTPRNDDQGRQVNTKFRARDWDYLGWRYSLISSIAVAGLHNIMSMVPARDVEEYEHFSKDDIAFFRRWIGWTDENRSYLRNTRFILGQPAIGRVDGTSAIVGNSGYLFLFNPNGRKLTAEFRLDQSIGLSGSGGFVIAEIYPETERLIGKPGAGFWAYGDAASVAMDGASARVLRITPAPKGLSGPQLFNVAGRARLDAGRLAIDGVSGEVGTHAQALVLLPRADKLAEVSANGVALEFEQHDRVVSVPMRFEGQAFSHTAQAGSYDSTFAGGRQAAKIAIPQRVFEQLKARQNAWPIPWTPEDTRTTWLAPQRLLLFVQVAEPKDDMAVPRLTIGGKDVELEKAYSSVRRNPGSFVGYYADISSLVPDRVYDLALEVAPLKPGQLQGVFFENIETEYTDKVIAAKEGTTGRPLE